MKWQIYLFLAPFLFCGAICFGAQSSLQAVFLQGEEYLSLRDVQSIGYRTFWQEEKQRLLVQSEKGHAAFLLVEGPYALVDGVAVYHPFALRSNKQGFFLSLRFLRENLLTFLPMEQRKVFPTIAMGKPPALPVTPIKTFSSTCMIERPVKKIFLDPGHGGADLGTAFHGIYEKNIVLKFSKLVEKELKDQGLEISFSRSKDVFLPLDIRSEIARAWQADLFISIHMNSSPSREATGTETYILSQEATDAEARKLALQENSVAKGVKFVKPIVQDILWDMEQTSYLQESAYLASFLQKSLVKTAHDLLQKKKLRTRWKNRGVRRAPFFVLSRAAMPAVLVELGYLSNDMDRKLLSDKNFQETLAKALANGVKIYRENCKVRQ